MWHARSTGSIYCIVTSSVKGVYPGGLIKVGAYMGGNVEKYSMDSNPMKYPYMGRVECIGGGVGSISEWTPWLESGIGINKDDSWTSYIMNLVWRVLWPLPFSSVRDDIFLYFERKT